MKIVQVANHFLPCMGGVERVVQDISAGLESRGHKVNVVCLNRCAYSKGPLASAWDAEGIAVERIPFLDLHYYKIAPSVLLKIRNADIVHVHGIGFFSDFLLLTKPLHRRKVFISTHGGIFHTKDMGLLKWLYFNTVQRILLPFADRVIAVSRNDAKIFSKVCSRLEIVENGIDISRFYAGKKQRDTFLFVGRFAQNKRVEKLLAAFAMLKKDAEYRLIIAGTDWQGLLEGYREKAGKLGIAGHVDFALNPSADELRGLYSVSEFFVSASQYEGFGISLVEAMASGCICIVQENEGFAQIISDGKDGILADFGNPENAATAIMQVVGAGRIRKAELAKNAAIRSKEFSWNARIDALEKLYGG